MNIIYIELLGQGLPNLTIEYPEEHDEVLSWEQLASPVDFYFSINPFLVKQGYLEKFEPKDIEEFMEGLTYPEMDPKHEKMLKAIRLALEFFVWENK